MNRPARPIVPDLPMTHDEIAHELGISRVRVAQLERSALKKLRASKLKNWANSNSATHDSHLALVAEPVHDNVRQSHCVEIGWFYKSR